MCVKYEHMKESLLLYHMFYFFQMPEVWNGQIKYEVCFFKITFSNVIILCRGSNVYEGGSESSVIGIITLLINMIGCCIIPGHCMSQVALLFGTN